MCLSAKCPLVLTDFELYLFIDFLITVLNAQSKEILAMRAELFETGGRNEAIGRLSHVFITAFTTARRLATS